MLLLIATLFMAHAEKYSADLYDLEGKTKMFTYEGERTMDGDTMTYSCVYKGLDGRIEATEKGTAKNGVFVNYEAARPPQNESGSVEVKEGKILFSYNENGKIKTSKDNFHAEDTEFSGTLVPYLQAHFDDLLAKKELSFRYVVWYRRETVGFKFLFDKEENGLVIAKMVPTNFLYRSLVDPLFFALDKKTKKLVYIKGRTMPQVKVDGSWKNVDAFVKYK
jgi:hypothetical protein